MAKDLGRTADCRSVAAFPGQEAGALNEACFPGAEMLGSFVGKPPQDDTAGSRDVTPQEQQKASRLTGGLLGEGAGRGARRPNLLLSRLILIRGSRGCGRS